MFLSKFVLFSIVVTLKSVQSDDELLAVSLLYRHGDRTPVQFYPNDPYKDASFWPTQPGELTNTGKLQHFELGQWLRNRYNGFLSPIYNRSEIYVRSSDANRCVMSAAANLAGLYPPQGKDVWKKGMPWQPIPVHSVQVEEDDIALVLFSCKNYLRLRAAAEKLPYWRRIDEENKDFYQFLTENSGRNITKIMDCTHLYDILLVEKIYNLTLPDWALEAFPKLEKIDNIAPQLFTYTPQLARLFTGRFYHTLDLQFTGFAGKRRFVKGFFERNEKFLVYSAHDYQVNSLLNVLKVKNLKRSTYAATVIFELRRSEENQVYVQVLYKTMGRDDAEIIQIENCCLKCELDKFLDIIKPITLTKKEYRNECNR